jgi:hypothetical protein
LFQHGSGTLEKLPFGAAFSMRYIEAAADHVVSLEKSRVKAHPDRCHLKKFYFKMILKLKINLIRNTFNFVSIQ